jgi:hypothetical protein
MDYSFIVKYKNTGNSGHPGHFGERHYDQNGIFDHSDLTASTKHNDDNKMRSFFAI